MSALGLLVLAEPRIRREEIERLVRLTAEADGASPQGLRRFRTEYWNCIAKATRNPLLQQSIRWWTTVLRKLEQRGAMQDFKDPLFPTLYQQLNEKLAEGRGVVDLYLSVIRPLHQLAAAKAAVGAQSAPNAKKAAPRRKRPRAT